MTTTKTVKDLMEGRNELRLVDFGAGKNYLALVRQPDGRVDLVDLNCDDTGQDVSHWVASGWRGCDLILQVSAWLELVDVDEAERDAIIASVGRLVA